MGTRGPVPKTDAERRRRNKPATETTKVKRDDEVRGPELTGEHTALAREFYEALRHSTQAMFYEPSDWAAARLVVEAIDTYARKPTGALLASIMSTASNLLVTEGDRRRLGLELGKPSPGDRPAGVTVLDDYRASLGGG